MLLYYIRPKHKVLDPNFKPLLSLTTTEYFNGLLIDTIYHSLLLIYCMSLCYYYVQVQNDYSSPKDIILISLIILIRLLD